jgi:hypothetical protein
MVKIINPARKKAWKKLKQKYLAILLIFYLGLIALIFLFNLLISSKIYDIDSFRIFENLFGMLSFSEFVVPKWVFISNTVLGMLHNALFAGIIVAAILEIGEFRKIPKDL